MSGFLIVRLCLYATVAILNLIAALTAADLDIDKLVIAVLFVAVGISEVTNEKQRGHISRYRAALGLNGADK